MQIISEKAALMDRVRAIVHSPNPSNPQDYRLMPGSLFEFHEIIRIFDALDVCDWPNEEYELHASHPWLWKPKP